MYIKTSPKTPPQQVTFSGKENEILNGIPDWVYEGKWNVNESFIFSVSMKKPNSYCFVLGLQEESHLHFA